MRVGDNQSRDKKISDVLCQHRVIIPIYIPHEEEYYKDAFKVFKLCLKSIKKGAVAVTPISVIANGCSQEIHKKLLDLVPQGLIDELFIETEQLGKINSIRKAIFATNEPFLTITDGDVLFLENWDLEVARVFTSFPKATAVAPVPIHKTFNQYVSNIWFDHLFSSRIAFAKAKDPEALEKFVQSIGWPYLNDHQKLEILTLRASDGKEAVVGCSHFCTTYKREVFQFAPDLPSEYVLSGDSEKLYLDLPTIQSNGYRLSTPTNHAFHLGNIWEPWMEERFSESSEREKKHIEWPSYKNLKHSTFRYFIKNRLFKKITETPIVYNWYLRKCHLNKAWTKYYFKQKN